jgi:hypothetical protein
MTSPVMVIGQEKGRGVTEKVMRNFGMPKAEGYRKALRLMETAERFQSTYTDINRHTGGLSLVLILRSVISLNQLLVI